MLSALWLFTQDATAQVTSSSSAQPSADAIAVCAEGMVGGLVTVSIAATTALIAEIALPPAPFLLGIGMGMGCSVRLVGEQLKSYGLELWYGAPAVRPLPLLHTP
jgi:hypothetical protein